MITKQDCYLLLFELNQNGEDVAQQISELSKMTSPTIELVQFINNKKSLDLHNFYEKMRKSYNDKHSKLYINIVKEIDDPNEVVITLSALLTQIMLFTKFVTNKQTFLRQARAHEITKVLSNYIAKQDYTDCIKLLRLIKADLKVLEGK